MKTTLNRRDFTLAAAALMAMPSAFAQIKAGENYLAVDPAAPVDAPEGKIEVIEFFSYGCPHCHSFEPTFDKWAAAQPQDVLVRRVHVGFNAAFEPLQRIFFALQAVGHNEKVHAQVFQAILKDKKDLGTLEAVQPWMVQHGIDGDKFAAAYKSFGVASRIKRAIALQEAYRVEATPSLGIAGRYYMDPAMAKSYEDMLKTADQLIARVRKEGGK